MHSFSLVDRSGFSARNKMMISYYKFLEVADTNIAIYLAKLTKWSGIPV